MPTYQRSVRVRAPFESVWDFHSRIEGLEALTPDFMHLTVQAVRGPDGDLDPVELVAGTEIDMQLEPFGVLGPQTWTSVITDREASRGAAYFVDEMRDGPFPEWRHTHSFFADGDETLVRDRVEYQLPLGIVGDALGPLGRVGFEPMFRDRHRRTKQVLE